MSLTPELIEGEYRRLGHTLGWRFLTCPERNLSGTSTALVTINPGGSVFEPATWSVEAGSAYLVESWKGAVPGQNPLQRQVTRMFEILGERPETVLSGYLVPFRSRSWGELPHKTDSLSFGLGLWREVLRIAAPTNVFAFGKDTAPHLRTILTAVRHASVSARWGEQTIDCYHFGKGGRLVVLPHLSRFALFGREPSETAFRDLLGL